MLFVFVLCMKLENMLVRKHTVLAVSSKHFDWPILDLASCACLAKSIIKSTLHIVVDARRSLVMFDTMPLPSFLISSRALLTAGLLRTLQKRDGNGMWGMQYKHLPIHVTSGST